MQLTPDMKLDVPGEQKRMTVAPVTLCDILIALVSDCRPLADLHILQQVLGAAGSQCMLSRLVCTGCAGTAKQPVRRWQRAYI